MKLKFENFELKSCLRLFKSCPCPLKDIFCKHRILICRRPKIHMLYKTLRMVNTLTVFQIPHNFLNKDLINGLCCWPK